MSFKTILAIIGREPQDVELERIIDLALGSRAHLSLMALDVAATPSLSDYPVDAGWLDRRVGDLEALHLAADRAKAKIELAELPFDVERYYTERAFVAELVYRRSLYTDVVVVGEGVRGNSALLGAVIDGAVFDARRPMLLLPGQDKSSAPVRKVLLAWNSRSEAAHAAREALDLMRHADEVHLTMVDPDASYFANGGEPGADMAAFLTRHEVNVVIDQLPSGGRPVEDILRSHALEIGADLIVMGAYGHSRIRERVFGGVTQALLEETPVPLLIAR